MAETVLVTGGTGYVGSWCIALLLQRGYAVRTTVRSLSKADGVRAAVAPVSGSVERLSFAAADLTSDDGWDAAMAGVDFVLHVASPLGGGQGGDRMRLVAPARDGTLRVLRAGVKAGVKRIVFTSAATAARAPRKSGRVSDETVWADENDAEFDAYRVSKILAEKAAWDFMRAEGGATEFVTILPGAVFGPVLSRDNLGSVGIINSILHGRPAAVPRIGFWVVDVRDLADLHIKAMLAPNAAGQRFIAAGDFMWMKEVGLALKARLGARASKASVRDMPSFMVRLIGPFTPLKSLLPILGRKIDQSSAKARAELGFAPRPATETIGDTGESLLAG